MLHGDVASSTISHQSRRTVNYVFRNNICVQIAVKKKKIQKHGRTLVQGRGCRTQDAVAGGLRARDAIIAKVSIKLLFRTRDGLCNDKKKKFILL